MRGVLNLKLQGQTAIETLMAIFLIAGIFVAISLISAQRSAISREMISQDQNAALCDQLAGVIDQLDASAGNTRYGFFLDRPIRIEKKSITFGSTNAQYCYYFGTVQNEDTGFDLGIGYYEMIKEGSQIEINAATPPA